MILKALAAGIALNLFFFGAASGFLKLLDYLDQRKKPTPK